VRQINWRITMLEFKIPAMSCGHCVKAVTEAVQAIDPKALVQADLASKQVRVQTQAERSAVSAALSGAGYAPAA
jgi:copper chaperone